MKLCTTVKCDGNTFCFEILAGAPRDLNVKWRPFPCVPLKCERLPITELELFGVALAAIHAIALAAAARAIAMWSASRGDDAQAG